MKHDFEIRMHGGPPVRPAKVGIEIMETFEQVEGFKHADTTWDGWKVVTNHREILLLVDDGSSCCENWGSIISEDDVTPFIGAELRQIDWTNPTLSKKLNVSDIGLDEGEVMFVDFVTSQGVLQLAVYNCHNGYYGHQAILVVDGVTEKEDYL